MLTACVTLVHSTTALLQLLEALRACEATTSGSSTASTACSVLECSVCIEEVALGANIAKLPCAHMFHSEVREATNVTTPAIQNSFPS